jgi:hypothetical protein
VARVESLERPLARARRPLSPGDIERQIGRILERTSRPAAKYTVRVESAPEHASWVRLVIQENKQWTEWLRQREDCYLLRSSVTGWTDEPLWRTYIQMCQAEAAFRVENSDLSIRPVWHHRPDRRQAARCSANPGPAVNVSPCQGPSRPTELRKLG